MANSSTITPLSKWERRGLVILLLATVLFGCLVEKRSAFMMRRMTDLDAYLRAGWAVRTGLDIYEVTDDNDWHYNYPPLFAILMVPLADPAAGADRAGMVPFPVSVAIWYVFNLAFLGMGIHWLACALEQSSPDLRIRNQPRFCRRWWALRVIPILACSPPIWHTLMRGQVNLLLLALLCGMAAAVIRGQRLRAPA